MYVCKAEIAENEFTMDYPAVHRSEYESHASVQKHWRMAMKVFRTANEMELESSQDMLVLVRFYLCQLMRQYNCNAGSARHPDAMPPGRDVATRSAFFAPLMFGDAQVYKFPDWVESNENCVICIPFHVGAFGKDACILWCMMTSKSIAAFVGGEGWKGVRRFSNEDRARKSCWYGLLSPAPALLATLAPDRCIFRMSMSYIHIFTNIIRVSLVLRRISAR